MTAERETAWARIEIDSKQAVPEGMLTWAEGRSVRFSGWVEFASAIEGWRVDASNGAGSGWASANETREDRRSQSDKIEAD